MPSVISRLYFNRINLSPFGLLCSKYASTACGIPPISIYNRNIRIRFLCIAFPADFLLFKSSLMVSAVISSPTAHKNSSKSIGYMDILCSSLGINISFVFFFIDKSDPVSMYLYLPSATRYLIACLAFGNS